MLLCSLTERFLPGLYQEQQLLLSKYRPLKMSFLTFVKEGAFRFPLCLRLSDVNACTLCL